MFYRNACYIFIRCFVCCYLLHFFTEFGDDEDEVTVEHSYFISIYPFWGNKNVKRLSYNNREKRIQQRGPGNACLFICLHHTYWKVQSCGNWLVQKQEERTSSSKGVVIQRMFCLQPLVGKGSRENSWKQHYAMYYRVLVHSPLSSTCCCLTFS